MNECVCVCVCVFICFCECVWKVFFFSSLDCVYIGFIMLPKAKTFDGNKEQGKTKQVSGKGIRLPVL